MATTRATVSFKVKEYESGQPWILIEWITGDDVFKGATMGFDLPEGTRLEEAKELAQHMRKITHLSRTERSEGQIGGHPSGLTTQRH
jgi:hypothetical protein